MMLSISWYCYECQHSLIKQMYLDNILTGTFHRSEKSAVQNRLLVKDMVTWGKRDSLTPNNMAVKMQPRSRWTTMEAMSESQSLLTLVTDTLSIRARFDKVTQEDAPSGRQAREWSPTRNLSLKMGCQWLLLINPTDLHNARTGGFTCRFVRSSSSNLGHHQARDLGGKLQQVREFLRHGAGGCISKNLEHAGQHIKSCRH